ncbi:MAG: hypothetical protein II336_13160 [Loktanella sp.]|nr:hypothetical protein [Loktanella sp.]
MTAQMASERFSIVRGLGRYSALERGMQFGQPYQPRPVVAALPGMDHDVLKAQLAPVLVTLDRDRAAHVARAERFLQIAAGGAALAGLALGWGLMGNLLLGLALASGAAFFALLLFFSKAREAPRAATRTAIVDALARHLMGFAVDPDPVVTRDGLMAVTLFHQIRKVTVDLYLTGQRDGRMVAISRIGLMFGAERNFKEKQADGLTFVMVEIALPETAQSHSVTTIMSEDASAIAKAAQKLTDVSQPIPTGDADFDARYTVFGDISRVTPALRHGFSGLERESRCAVNALTEVPAGEGLRPWVVILPGKLVVLTPLSMFDGAFEPPPYWEKLDPDVLIPAFASDLAILNRYINAALSLPLGDIT